MISKWKMAALSVVTCVAAFQVGCTDREVGAGVAGAVIGAILVDSSHRQPPPPPVRHCRVEQVQRCVTTRDYYGRPYQSCSYESYDSCRGGRYRKMSLAAGNSAADLELGNIAETYKLSTDGASKLIAALSMAQSAQDDSGAQEAFAQLGVTVEEMKALGNSGVPSADMVDRMAKALNQDPQLTQMMVNSILETARAQQAARNQPDAA